MTATVQKPSYFLLTWSLDHPDDVATLGWLLEEIHVTWAQLEKKRTRPRLFTNYLKGNPTDHGDGVTNHTRRRHITQETTSWISRWLQNVSDSKKP
ncbi:hypothetical protein Tco_1540275 [Tanacetum coccineum]